MPACRSKGLFSYSLSLGWATSVGVICLFLYPFVDPLIYQPWSALAQQATTLLNPSDTAAVTPSMGLSALPLPSVMPVTAAGDVTASMAPLSAPNAVAGVRPYRESLLLCVRTGDYASLGLHFAATCLLGPLWEEVRRSSCGNEAKGSLPRSWAEPT